MTWSGRRVGDEEEAVLLLLDLPAEAHERFGAPGQLSIELVFPRGEPRVDFVVQWFDKPANRLPEAAWFSFVLPDHGLRWRRSWRMDKLGEWVSPLDVVRNGNRRLHAVGSGLCADDGRLAVSVETLDAPLVAPGRPSLIDFGNRQPDLRDGLHFNLHNNLWGTDFPQWYEDDALFRFSLRLTHRRAGGDMPRRSRCPGRDG